MTMDMEHGKQPFELHDFRVSSSEEIGEELAEMKGGNEADRKDMLRMGKTQELRVRRQ